MEENKIPLLQVENLSTYFHMFNGTVKAVDGISFSLAQGEILGIVGESGSGKSVSSFSIIGLVDEPGEVRADRILFNGRDLTRVSEQELMDIRGKDISMVFQDPMTSLNPLYTIGRQIEEVLLLHDKQMSKEDRHQRCVELLRMVGVPDPESRLKAYPHQFSGGMRQRVIIAIALAAAPKLVIADEPTTALDVTIQAQILRLMKTLVREQGSSLILITHDLAVVSETVDRIAVMYCGKIVEEGSTRQVIGHPAHPYSRGLQDSVPKLRQEQTRLDFIPGMVPNMFDLPKGCLFAPRCKYHTEACERAFPPRVDLGDGHSVACIHPLTDKTAETGRAV